jgi:hypothetical protein
VSRALRRAVAATAVGAVLTGCGTPAPDLFVVRRTGTVPGARMNLLVSDTSVRCNLGPHRPLTSAQTLTARNILTDLRDLQEGKKKPPPGRGEIFSYSVRDQDGTLFFGDTTRVKVLERVQAFTRMAATSLCGLAR